MSAMFSESTQTANRKVADALCFILKMARQYTSISPQRGRAKKSLVLVSFLVMITFSNLALADIWRVAVFESQAEFYNVVYDKPTYCMNYFIVVIREKEHSGYMSGIPDEIPNVEKWVRKTYPDKVNELTLIYDSSKPVNSEFPDEDAVFKHDSMAWGQTYIEGGCSKDHVYHVRRSKKSFNGSSE